MTDSVYTQILKGRNQCALTGIEKQVHTSVMGTCRITAYRDNYGQIRVTAKSMDNFEVISAILYDYNYTVRFRYTDSRYRGNNLTRHIHAYTQAFIDKRVRHSEYLTEAGEASL